MIGTAIGASLGVLIGGKITRRIEIAGVFYATWKTHGYNLIVVSVIVAPAVIALWNQDLYTGFILLGDYAYPVVLTTYVARMSYFLYWERRHTMEIVSEGVWGTRFRANAKHP